MAHSSSSTDKVKKVIEERRKEFNAWIVQQFICMSLA